MNAEEQVSAHDAAFVITEMLEGATDMEDAELIEDVRSKLPLACANARAVRALEVAEGLS